MEEFPTLHREHRALELKIYYFFSFLATFAFLDPQQFKDPSLILKPMSLKPVLRIRIILMRIRMRILLSTLMRIRILPFTLILNRMPPFNLIRIPTTHFFQIGTLQCFKMTL